MEQGELPRLEIHDASRAYRFEDGAAAQLRTDLAQAAIESSYRRFTGKSTVRQMAEGTLVTLSQHDTYQGDSARFKEFQQQVKFFTGNARQLHEHTHHIMNEEKKASIKKMLQQ